jgi:hypothetical protein
LQAEIAQRTEEIAKLKDTNTSQAERLEDAASMLSDKDRLEDIVKKQVGWQQQQQHHSSRAAWQYLVTGSPAAPAAHGQPQPDDCHAPAALADGSGWTLLCVFIAMSHGSCTC